VQIQNPMIHLRNLTFSYSQEQPKVFDGLDLRIQRDSWVIITGPDRSGKSTLAKLLKGLLVPNSGAIHYEFGDGNPAMSVGYLGGDPYDLAVGITVEEDIVFGMENMRLPRHKMAERLQDSLARTGLAGMESRLVHTLSGGEQQKLALAGVLAMDVEVLIIDEAMGMLDRMARRSVRSIIRSLRETPGLTVIEASNNMEDLQSADRVLFLSGDAVEFDGTPAEFLWSSPGRKWASLSGGLHGLRNALQEQGHAAGSDGRMNDKLIALCRNVE
jgi:energy-coupling factor transport system ATP-binding protein